MFRSRTIHPALAAGILVAFTTAASVAAPNGAPAPRGNAPAPRSNAAPAPRSTGTEVRQAGSVTFRSMGDIKAMLFTIHRDRSTTLTPVLQGGKLVAVKARIVDHADNDKIIEGMMKSDPEGHLSADDPQIVNSCALLSLTPKIVRELKANNGTPVVTMGATEISGKVHATRMEHSLIGPAGANGVIQIKTVTQDENGIINMETLTMMGPDGLPVEAKTSGSIKKGLVTLSANLRTVRVPNQVAANVGE